jgi:hypothetical protein
MKLKMFVLFTVAILLVGNAIGGEDKTVLTSSALIAQPMYEFKPVVDGTKVTYDYIIKILDIKNPVYVFYSYLNLFLSTALFSYRNK